MSAQRAWDNYSGGQTRQRSWDNYAGALPNRQRSWDSYSAAYEEPKEEDDDDTGKDVKTGRKETGLGRAMRQVRLPYDPNSLT